MFPCMYPSTITHKVQKITPRNIREGMIGSLGSVVGEVFSLSEFVSLDVFGSVFFAFEMTDSGVVSILIF